MNTLIMYYADGTYGTRIVAVPYLVKAVIGWQHKRVTHYQYAGGEIVPIAMAN
jgi:hypothetical protein